MFKPGIIVVLLLLAWQVPAAAADASALFKQEQGMVLAARGDHRPPPGQKSFAPRLGSKDAASAVKRNYRNRKILSVNLIESKGPPVYRVKTLSDKGVVKYVYVDGQSGEVFE